MIGIYEKLSYKSSFVELKEKIAYGDGFLEHPTYSSKDKIGLFTNHVETYIVFYSRFNIDITP